MMPLLGLCPDDVRIVGDKFKSQVPASLDQYLSHISEALLTHDGHPEDIDELLFMADVVIDYAWERLNTNLWVFVDDHLRLLYGYGTLYKALLVHIKSKSLDSVVKLCDLGLLMTGHLLENKFNTIIRHVRGQTTTSELKHSGGQDDHSPPRIKVPRTEDLVVISDQHALAIEDSPSVERFRDEYLAKQVPCIIRNQMNHWPALQKWRFVSPGPSLSP